MIVQIGDIIYFTERKLCAFAFLGYFGESESLKTDSQIGENLLEKNRRLGVGMGNFFARHI